MINKITGYSGFRSYGELQYPSQKQGKQLQLSNKIWQSTVKQSDKLNPLNNFHYQKSLYKQNHTQNTNPKDYHPEHVPKGGNTSLNFGNNSVTKAYDKEQSQKIIGNNARDNLLQTGTEHWKTNYQNEMVQSLSKTQTHNWNATSKSQSLSKEQQRLKNLSYKNRPYINNSTVGVSEYKFMMGYKIGQKPSDLLDLYSSKQPLINNPLKQGTNQMWTEIPGYQGFKPAEVPFDELKSKIQARAQVNKGNPKLNLTQNYHINIPGYSGFKPKYSDVDNQLRSSCLSYK